jgi:hypothetical protein
MPELPQLFSWCRWSVNRLRLPGEYNRILFQLSCSFEASIVPSGTQDSSVCSRRGLQSLGIVIEYAFMKLTVIQQALK